MGLTLVCESHVCACVAVPPLLSHGCVFSCLKSHVRVGAGTREDAVLVCCIALVLKWRELWARRDNARMRYATVKDARVHA